MLRKIVQHHTNFRHYATLTGKLAVVVGGSRGIGKAVASTLANRGASVALVSRTITSESTTHLSKTNDQQHNTYVCNVDDENHVANIIRQIENSHFKEAKGIDILINCAGVNRDGLLVQYPVDEMQRLYKTNVLGTMITCKAAVRSMIRHKIKGCIVNVASALGHSKHASGQSVYAGSKSAIIGFTKSLAKEMLPKNIRVNAIAPGFVKTDMTNNVSQDLVKETVTGEMASVEEIAEAITFLVESQYITGQVLVVDGGLSL
jgi:carbonyl reductase 4